MPSQLVHLHFGAGRLGLGLIAPWFQKEGSQLHLFNRALSTANATGTTGLDPERRNRLLREHPDRTYLIRKPGVFTDQSTVVRYDSFQVYRDGMGDVEATLGALAPGSFSGGATVIVTASLLKAEHYAPVIAALNVLSAFKEESPEALGKIYLVACENTLSAHEVFQHPAMRPLTSPSTERQVNCVHALVDRMCVGLEEVAHHGHPAVLVRAEDYGSIKLELRPETEGLVEACRGSRVEFSKHVDVEKQIKSWQLNGTHWLIALHALHDRQRTDDFKLNDYLRQSPEHRRFAEAVMGEMSEGIAILLREDPRYEAFCRDVNVSDYLRGAANAILHRFEATDDSITRILARFQTPTPDFTHSVQAFAQRFADRVDPPLAAYEAKKGALPEAATRSFLSLYRLIAKGTFIDTVRAGSGAEASAA